MRREISVVFVHVARISTPSASLARKELTVSGPREMICAALVSMANSLGLIQALRVRRLAVARALGLLREAHDFAGERDKARLLDSKPAKAGGRGPSAVVSVKTAWPALRELPESARGD